MHAACQPSLSALSPPPPPREVLWLQPGGYCCYYFFLSEPQIKNPGSQQVPSSPLLACTQIKKFLASRFPECGSQLSAPPPCPGALMWGRRGSLGSGTRVRMGEWGPPVHPFGALACLRPLKGCGRGETVLRAHTDPGCHLPESAY